MSACMTACTPPPFVCITFQSFFPTHSSFNGNSVFLWLFPSSLHTHLFTCHFPFMSITVSLHVSFLRCRTPSLFFIPPLFHCLHMQSLPAFIFCFPFPLYWHLLSSVLSISEFSLFSWNLTVFTPSLLQDAPAFYLLAFSSVSSHTFLFPSNKQHLLSFSFYSRPRQWVSDLNLSLHITAPPLCGSGTPLKKPIARLPPCPHLCVRV